MPSPYQRQLFSAIQAAGRLDIQVRYLTQSAPDRNWASEPLSPYEKLLSGATLRWLGPSAHWNPEIIDVLKSELYELFVLSDYSAPTTQFAMRWLTWHKKKWVFWGEIPGYLNRGRLGSALRRQLQQPIAKGAIAIAAMGSHAVEAYRHRFTSIPVFNIPYFCDLAPFKNAALKRYKCEKATIDILYSGQLIRRKGVDVLIHAFIRICEEIPNVRLQLLGAGPCVNYLMRMIPFQFRDRVNFLGFEQPDSVPKLFASADIFVLPSRHDGWGVVVNEALGAGLPIIVSDRVGARDLVQSEVNGLIVPAGDVDGLAAALLRLAGCPSLRRSFAMSSAARANQWGLDEGVTRWQELADQIL